jgi:hypothetical protein
MSVIGISGTNQPLTLRLAASCRNTSSSLAMASVSCRQYWRSASRRRALLAVDTTLYDLLPGNASLTTVSHHQVFIRHLRNQGRRHGLDRERSSEFGVVDILAYHNAHKRRSVPASRTRPRCDLRSTLIWWRRARISNCWDARVWKEQQRVPRKERNRVNMGAASLSAGPNQDQ